MPTDCGNAIDARGLSKRYGRVQAVSDLTLHVRAGEVFGFLGPNGAGKTTSVKMLVGLVRPTAGRATVLGAPLGNRAARRSLGYLPELFRYPDWMTAAEVLSFHARLASVGDAGAEIARVLQLVGLAARSADRVGAYSKGMQQRLGLAVALLGRPDLIVLDEPTSALDPAGRLEVREILRGLRESGAAVFLNSHLLTEVEHVCDRIAIVSRGRVVAQGSIPEIVGAQHGVRIRARANGTPLETLLAPFGSLSADRGAVVIAGLAPDRVPEVASALVRGGAEIYALEPLAPTLEDRFLELTQERGG